MSPQHFLSDEGLYVFALMGSVLGLISYQRLDGRKDIQSVNSAWSKGCTMNTHTHTHTHTHTKTNTLMVSFYVYGATIKKWTGERWTEWMVEQGRNCESESLEPHDKYWSLISIQL